MSDLPRIQLSRQLMPQLSHFKFDREQYAEAMTQTGLSDELIARHTVRFSGYSAADSFWASFRPRDYTRLDAKAAELTVFPKQIHSAYQPHLARILGYYEQMATGVSVSDVANFALGVAAQGLLDYETFGCYSDEHAQTMARLDPNRQRFQSIVQIEFIK